MSDITPLGAVWMGEDEWLGIADMARVCGVSTEFIEVLMAEELLVPARSVPTGFGGAEIARVRRILRLQRDFEASLQSVAVLLDLLDENDRLRARLRRAGIDAG